MISDSEDLTAAGSAVDEPAPPTWLEWVGTELYRLRVAVWLILFLLTVLAGTLLRLVSGESFLKRYSYEGLIALSIACCIALISEVPVFKNYLQERFASLLRVSDRNLLAKIDALADRHFIRQIQDRDILKALDPGVRRKLETDLQGIELQRPIPAEVQELLEKVSGVRRDVSVWRSDSRWLLNYEEVPENANAYRIRSDKSFSYRNWGENDVEFNQPLTVICDHIEGLPDSQVHTADILQVDGKELSGNPPVLSNHDHRIKFDRSVPLRIPASAHGATAVSIRERSTTVYPHSVPWITMVSWPLHCFDLTIQHPPYIIPTLYVFGLGADPRTLPLRATQADERVHIWNYKGWCYRSQGMVLLFTRRDAITANPLMTPARGTAAVSG